MTVKNWKFSSNNSGNQRLKQNILDAVSLWIAIGLLWFSFLSMLGEKFPDFMVEIDWGWIICLTVVLWLGFDWPSKYLRKAERPCELLGIAMPVIYIVTRIEEVISGLIYIVNIYLPCVNNYYKTHFALMTRGDAWNASTAFSAICMVLWTLIWLVAYKAKKRILLVLFPVIALSLELVVGLSPIGGGLPAMFYAGMLLMLLGGTSVLKKVVAMALVFVSVWLAGTWFQEDIGELASLDTKQWLLRVQNNLDIKQFNPFNLFQMDLHANAEQLNNNSPEYTGKIILEIETDRMPSSTVYLKGFYGTRYENGNWVYDDSEFQAACKAAGKSPEEVAEQIFQIPYERGSELGKNLSSINSIEYKINYIGTTGNVAYVPYVSDYTTADDKYTFLGDYLLKKSITDNRIKISGINMSQDIARWRMVNTWIQRGNVEGYDFFNSLSKSYLEVPEGTEYLDMCVESIKAFVEEGYKREVEEEGENYRRLLYAEKTADYLDMFMAYSLKLDNLPADKDPMEYAFTTSHEGYCMHFASLATLILRKADVPARYVSGYSVNQYLFVQDKETGTYKADVADYMAHAWVEIYLDNIGWVAVEMTPGSSLTSLPSAEEIEQWEKESNENRQIWGESETPTESEETESQEPETQTQDSEDEDTEENSQSEQNTPDRPQNNQTGLGGGLGEIDWDKVWTVLGTFCIIAGGVFAMFFSIKYSKNRYDAVLDKEVEKNMTRKVVKRINRRLYGLLRLSRVNNWFSAKWSDAEYRNLLVERFTTVSEEEWDKYMHIVKKNHYSKEVVTEEEMRFCYECYKRVEVRR